MHSPRSIFVHVIKNLRHLLHCGLLYLSLFRNSSTIWLLFFWKRRFRWRLPFRDLFLWLLCRLSLLRNRSIIWLRVFWRHWILWRLLDNGVFAWLFFFRNVSTIATRGKRLFYFCTVF